MGTPPAAGSTVTRYGSPGKSPPTRGKPADQCLLLAERPAERNRHRLQIADRRGPLTTLPAPDSPVRVAALAHRGTMADIFDAAVILATNRLERTLTEKKSGS